MVSFAEMLRNEVSYDPSSGFFWYNGKIPKKVDTSQGFFFLHSERIDAARAAYAYMTGEQCRFVIFKDGNIRNFKFENLNAQN